MIDLVGGRGGVVIVIVIVWGRGRGRVTPRSAPRVPRSRRWARGLLRVSVRVRVGVRG